MPWIYTIGGKIRAKITQFEQKISDKKNLISIKYNKNKYLQFYGFGTGFALPIGMKAMQTMGKTLSLFLMSLSLVYCGAQGDSGTNGGAFQILDGDGNPVAISIPVIDTVRTGTTITISVEELESVLFFSHFEVERKVGAGEFVFLIDIMDGSSYANTGLASGTYTYRVRAVYQVAGVYHFSDYSNESAKQILPIAQPGEDVAAGVE